MFSLSFWSIKKGNKIGIIDQKYGSFTYKQLQQLIDQMKQEITSKNKKLGIVLCDNHVYSLAGYLAGLQVRDAVMLLDAQMNEGLFKQVLAEYQPDWIMTFKELNSLTNYQQTEIEQEYILYHKISESKGELHPDLALLLSTSGTTGSSKFVRLSYQNLQSNAESIVEYLELNEKERPITTLPMQYSYGLSVINSHLHAEGTLLLTSESILSKGFWEFFKQHEATSFSGVPYTYQMLQRLRFERMELPSLRYFTQAGGRLSDKLIGYFQEIAEANHYLFYVMYGQTEATARISYVSPQELSGKVGSIGKVIPGGRLHLDAETNELIYEGDNVMLGYAHSRADLAKGDELQGILRTGDVAEQDEDGFFYIKGRMKRFIKLFGLRISLDDVEKSIERQLGLAVACTGDDEKMVVALEDTKSEQVSHFIRDTFKLHPRSYKVIELEQMPRLSNGKVDYSKLKEL
ncbi:AMP-binding protein [Bacillus tianshenii]|nr:AMP-binding protein [Bacillus tianshenii]